MIHSSFFASKAGLNHLKAPGPLGQSPNPWRQGPVRPKLFSTHGSPPFWKSSNRDLLTSDLLSVYNHLPIFSPLNSTAQSIWVKKRVPLFCSYRSLQQTAFSHNHRYQHPRCCTLYHLQLVHVSWTAAAKTGPSSARGGGWGGLLLLERWEEYQRGLRTRFVGWGFFVGSVFFVFLSIAWQYWTLGQLISVWNSCSPSETDDTIIICSIVSNSLSELPREIRNQLWIENTLPFSPDLSSIPLPTLTVKNW